MAENVGPVTLKELRRARFAAALAVVENGKEYADFLAWIERQIELAGKEDVKTDAQAVLDAMMAGR